MKVLSKVFFDWVAFEKYNRFYSDVSKFLTVEPLELLGLADDPAVVLYSVSYFIQHMRLVKVIFLACRPTSLPAVSGGLFLF